jgi:NIMA (never in mitosis gene a)-related kinase
MGCCGLPKTNTFVTETTHNNDNDDISSIGNIEDEKFIFLCIEGNGFSGKSIKVKSNKTNIYYIIKVIEDRKKLKHAINEALLLGKCRHPNIVKIKQVYKERNGNKISINIVTDYANDGDLYKKLKENKCYDEETLIFWLMQICFGLSYLHKKHIFHRDIKPQNIFLNKNELIKIGDLGFAKLIKNEKDEMKRKQTCLGTKQYMSPEMKKGIYNSKTDIYSLGKTIKDFIKDETNYSESFNNLINSLTEEELSRRPSADEILNNPLIKDQMKRFLEVHNFENSLAYKIFEKIKGRKVKDEDSFFKLVKEERK